MLSCPRVLVSCSVDLILVREETRLVFMLEVVAEVPIALTNFVFDCDFSNVQCNCNIKVRNYLLIALHVSTGSNLFLDLISCLEQ